MNLFDVIHQHITFYLSIPWIALPAVAVLMFLLFRRPKIFICIFMTAIVAAAVVHLFSKLSMLGLEHRPLPLIEKRLSQN